MTPLQPDAINRLLANTEPWLSCDDCFEQLDLAIEDVLSAAAPLAETVRVHLAACPVCREEAQSLVTLVAPDFGLTPSEAAARLDAVLQDRRS